MRTISVLALVAWAVVVPGALRAGDLSFALDGAGEYDNNVFRSSQDEKDDFLFRLTPSVRLHDDRGQDLRYSLLYALPVEFAVEHSEVDDVDQRILGNVTYHVGDRLSLFASDDFRYLRNELRTNLEGTDDASSTLLVNEERDRITLNDAGAGATYQFTPRLLGSLQLEHEYYDPSRDDRSETNAAIGTTSLQYALTPKHKLGGGLRGQWQRFDETQDLVGSTAQSYSVFGTWDWAIDEKTALSAAAGPAVILSQQDDPSATELRTLVPSRNRGPFTAGPGLLDRDGVPIPVGTEFPDGALLVANINSCPLALINGTPQPVLAGGKSCTLNVALSRSPGTDDDLIAEIEGAPTVQMNNTDPSPEGEDSTNLTVFALLTLRRDWTPTLRSALTYRRDQGTASGLGGSVVADSVTLVNTYDFTEKWQFSMRGEWSLRTSVDDATRTLFLAQEVGFVEPSDGIAGTAATPGGSGILVTQRTDETSIDTMRWGVAGRVTRFLTRNTSGYLQLTYNKQDSQSDSLGSLSDFDNLLVTLGVRHVFRPIKLW